MPVYPYVGEVDVRMGLYPFPGRGERPALKGEDRGFREYKVATLELLPQTENIFLVYKEGWHNPETHPENPSVERMWTKKDAFVTFKNPNFNTDKRTDVIVYLQGDTCVKCFTQTPELTVSVGNNVGLRFPIDGPQVFLKKIRVKAADLGTDEWTDLRLSMNESFVPKNLNPPLNDDDRELGVNVYHLYVVDAGLAGSPEGVVDAVALAPAAPSPAAAVPAAKKPLAGFVSGSGAEGGGAAVSLRFFRESGATWTSGRRATAGWTWPRSCPASGRRSAGAGTSASTPTRRSRS